MRARRSVRRVLRSLPFVCALLTAAAAAQESIPIAARYGVERVRLPQGEHMGLAGATLLFGVGQDWSLGPSIYGAASGERGGFFVGGLEVQRRWTIAPRWALTTGLYAGGGGGAGAPVGGGLMWRPSVSLMRSEHLPRPSLILPDGAALIASDEALYDYMAWIYYWWKGWLGPAKS